jgi:hypothetical protein
MFTDGGALVAALSETGSWSVDQIEIHELPQHLFGYKGDTRSEVAHIIVRRKHIGQYSNDLGFVKQEDGTYKAIISEYDSTRFNSRWREKLRGEYAFQKIRKDMTKRGRKVSRFRQPNGTQKVVVTGYR